MYLTQCCRSFMATERGWSIPVIRRRHRGTCRWSMLGQQSCAPWSGLETSGSGSGGEAFQHTVYDGYGDLSQRGEALHVRVAPVLVPASLDAAGRAAFPGDRPTAG